MNKRLKMQYHTNRKTQINRFPTTIYPNLRSSIIKKFSTIQEKAAYFQHSIECKQWKVKLRAKRGKSLATVNDDLKTSAYDLAKSWKHNSKRKHQHYKE